MLIVRQGQINPDFSVGRKAPATGRIVALHGWDLQEEESAGREAWGKKHEIRNKIK
jgi:hypothetical protein